MTECICDPDASYGYDVRCRVHGHAARKAECEHCLPDTHGGLICQHLKGWCPPASVVKPGRHARHAWMPKGTRRIWGDLLPIEHYRNGHDGRHRAPDDVPDTTTHPQVSGLVNGP